MDTYAFRGSAGEVLCGFVRPGTLVTLIPVVLVTAFAGFVAVIAADVVGNGAPVVLGLGVIVSSAIVGRFALAARDGDLEAGFVTARFDRSELTGFVLRYVVLTLGWSIPVVLIAVTIVSQLGPAVIGGGLTGALVAAGPVALVVVALAVVVLLAPTLSFIVATSTETVGEVLSLAPWRWLLGERRRDLLPFYATLFGGSLLFASMVGALLVVLAVLSLAVSVEVAMAVLGLAWVAPAAGTPILLGRLCGAFVASEGVLRDPDEGMRQTVFASEDVPPAAVVALAGITAPVAPSPPSDARPSGDGLGPADVQRRLRSAADTDLAGAITDGEEALGAYPSNAGIAAELAGLYVRAGRTDDANRAAAIAVARALRSGAGPFAAEVLGRFAAARDALDLDGAELQQLGWALLDGAHVADAAWCFDRAATRADDAKVEKGLLAVAEAMAEAGEVDAALARFEAFLTEYPSSMLAGQARSALARLSRGAGAAADGGIG